jgi:hypothetical protein
MLAAAFNPRECPELLKPVCSTITPYGKISKAFRSFIINNEKGARNVRISCKHAKPDEGSIKILFICNN